LWVKFVTTKSNLPKSIGEIHVLVDWAYSGFGDIDYQSIVHVTCDMYCLCVVLTSCSHEI